MPELTIMGRFFADRSQLSQQQICCHLVGEIEQLLTLKLPLVEPGSWPETAGEIEAALRSSVETDPDHDVDATISLIRLLSTDRSLAGFINDLAEILFLPREKRSEYANNRYSSAPWVMSKLLLEYATRGWRLDQITGVLSKGHCARSCDRLPVGCCSVLGYDLGLVPEGMLAAQRIEAFRNGWSEPAREQKCRYHTDTGCVLAVFKSPACTGFLCESLERELDERYPAEDLERFRRRLARFRNCDVDRRAVFSAMDATITASRRLLGAGSPTLIRVDDQQ
jgi:hypothetical protein